MKVPEQNMRTECIMVRLSPSELQLIEQAMELTGLNRAQYVRVHALQAARTGSTLKPASEAPAAR